MAVALVISGCGGSGGDAPATPPVVVDPPVVVVPPVVVTPVVGLASVTTNAASAADVPTVVTATFRSVVTAVAADAVTFSGTCAANPTVTYAIDSTGKIVTATLAGANCSDGQALTLSFDPAKVTFATPAEVSSPGTAVASTFTTPTVIHPARTVAGTLSGLTTGSVTLLNNAGDSLPVSANGTFTFATPVAYGAAYAVTAVAPAGQTCSVSNGTGSIAEANVTNVAVTCSLNNYSVAGTLSGLTGSIVLRNNGVDPLPLNADGSFTFPTTIAQGSAYAVTVATPPVDQTCSVTNGTGTISAANVSNVTVACAVTPTSLTASRTNVALSVNNPGADVALVGSARTVTLTNSSPTTAFAVAVTPDPTTVPAGTTVTTSCGANVAAGTSCTVTITPGNTPTGTPFTETAPATPIAIAVTGSNISTLNLTARVLTYGSFYEGGYVFAVNDQLSDYPATQSVGGKVAEAADRVTAASGRIWSSDAAGVFDGGVGIYGADQASTPGSASPSTGQVTGQVACDGDADGSCNSNNIRVYYDQTPVPNAFYAAGQCAPAAASFSDWYLPAICELGDDSAVAGSACAIGQTLFAKLGSSLASLTGKYWSSTQTGLPGDPVGRAWYQDFIAPGVGDQFDESKGVALGVRCVRALTQ